VGELQLCKARKIIRLQQILETLIANLVILERQQSELSDVLALGQVPCSTTSKIVIVQIELFQIGHETSVSNVMNSGITDVVA